ncbi:DUF5994 family protein [Streptomyces monomycini]|uniref:DUF5994 family protein n=1 Tax=Streptomyces monomycini TaxID=371720 RepID=UPI00051862CA|nr:DUF5994 family protein [Streptomyces monomycini]
MTVLDETTTASTGPRTARLRLTPTDRRSGPLDGAWWPCSRDLVRELPALTAILDLVWGRITSVTVNPTCWPVIPRKVAVNGHVVRVGAFGAEQDPHELFLASYTVGRWDLLIVPPETAPDRAAALMLAAADPHNALTASGLLKTVGPPTVASGRRTAGTRNVPPGAVEWENEGGAVRTAPAPSR